MTAWFADTSYFVALCGPRDSFHEIARSLSSEITGRLVTTEYVMAETGGLLLRPVQSDPEIIIVPASQALFQSGFDLFARRLDKEWSLVDCVSFVVMKQRRLKAALTSDHHFVEAGFRALLREG